MEFNNKTLALVLVLTVAVTIFGTMINISKLATLHAPLPKSPTGFAGLNDTANVTLIISKTASIRFFNATCSWGSGQVLGYCTMETNNSGFINSSTCLGFTTANDCLVLENNGTAKVSVRINFSDNATTMFGGSTVLSLLQYNITHNESGSCTIYGNWSSYWSDVNITDEWSICSNFLPTDASDSLRLDFKVAFNENVTSGTKTLNITAIAINAE